ncbi:GLPGLI family protein [Soonwooa buanensis]|uniref:GLPGLI family protein n=1 Tax=Soonwooa buanensis TaxID=619805 RepID=A0A1T5EEU5_9FLAO|nr:GLPGLI family protein [Soonwooa buanensis]SKB82473.1 GLPGLI family protein [Soonwooa buanensis]
MNIKKLISLSFILFVGLLSAQENANRFFYELSFKPKKDSAKIDKVMTILDITSTKSQYEDFTGPAQDSILKVKVEGMQKSGIFEDISKSMKMPKFSYKIQKAYPDMKITVSDMISNRNAFGYEEPVKFDWKISNDKQMIGKYNTQKATTEFGGRKWTAWFSTDLPFQDGPYKFYGLPGLIVKIEDDAKNYSWELKGNKQIKDWKELSYGEEMRRTMGYNPKVTIISKDKFDATAKVFRQDPFGEFRQYMTPEAMKMTMPGTQMTMGEFIKNQEKLIKDFLAANDNPIEITETAAEKKK